MNFPELIGRTVTLNEGGAQGRIESILPQSDRYGAFYAVHAVNVGGQIHYLTEDKFTITAPINGTPIG